MAYSDSGLNLLAKIRFLANVAHTPPPANVGKLGHPRFDAGDLFSMLAHGSHEMRAYYSLEVYHNPSSKRPRYILSS